MDFALVIASYVVTGTFLFWYIPFITRNRDSWVWTPSRFVHFLFGGSHTVVVLALFIQVVAPAALLCWASFTLLHLLSAP